MIEEQRQTQLVRDPVGHISISGVQGPDEIEERINYRSWRREPGSPLKPLLLGAAIGIVVMLLLKRR
jgi:hypothetical protein